MHLLANIVLHLLAASSSVTANEVQDARISVHVTVVVPADTAADATVYLAGSLPAVGAWKADGLKLARQPDGTFAADLSLEPGATLDFKFTRGSWATVEKTADGGDRANRSVTIDASTKRIDATVERWAGVGVAAAATTRVSTVVGTLKLHDIESAALKSTRTVRVWLPPGYDATRKNRYDVLYLHDGQNCFDRATSAFGHEWEVDETLTRLIDDKAIRPLIVVGIDNGGAARLDELTFEPDPKHGGGKGEAYEKFLLKEVRPFVEERYHAAGGREQLFIGGSSLGGLASLEIARRNADVFAGVIAMSPSLFWNDQSLSKEIEGDASAFKGTRVWIDVGTREVNDGKNPDRNDGFVNNVRRLDAALTAGRIEHRLVVADGAVHYERAWAERFGDAVKYLLNR